MKFFADTASLEELKYCFSRDVNDGITTNPKIIETTGDLSGGFETACRAILEKYPDVPVSLETDLRGMAVDKIHSKPEEVRDVLLEQAHELAGWGKNVVIKIPMCEGGLLATKILAGEGIKTNVTACMIPYQALKAVDAGATYVSLFANRMLDSHILELSGKKLEEVLQDLDWKQIVKTERAKYLEQAWLMTLSQITYVAKALDTEPSNLIVGSIRSPEDIHKIATAKPQVITIPTKIVRGLKNIADLKEIDRSFRLNNVYKGDSLYHPMTQYTLEEFERAADAYRKQLNEI